MYVNIVDMLRQGWLCGAELTSTIGRMGIYLREEMQASSRSGVSRRRWRSRGGHLLPGTCHSAVDQHHGQDGHVPAWHRDCKHCLDELGQNY
jgi:hypothetical protein